MRNHLSLLALAVHLPALSLALNAVMNPAELLERHTKRDSPHSVCSRSNILKGVIAEEGTACYPYHDIMSQCRSGMDLEEAQSSTETPNADDLPSLPEQKECICNSDKLWPLWSECLDCARENGGKEGQDWFGDGYLRAMSSSYCEPTRTPTVWGEFLVDFLGDYMATASATTSGWTQGTVVPYAEVETGNKTGEETGQDGGEEDQGNAAGRLALNPQMLTGVVVAGIGAAAIFL